MKKTKFKAIRIYFKDGKVDEIPKKLWTDYRYDDGLFVVIYNGAWIGIGSSVCNNKTIGANAIVGAGAVVVEDIPGNCTAVGCPAKPLMKKD